MAGAGAVWRKSRHPVIAKSTRLANYYLIRPRGITHVPFIFFSSLLLSPLILNLSLPLSLSLPQIASPQQQCARDVPWCMTLDQSEGTIPKVYLLWLEPGSWPSIKDKRPQSIDSLWAPSHAACAGYHLPVTGFLKAKTPPPKGKGMETFTNA